MSRGGECPDPDKTLTFISELLRSPLLSDFRARLQRVEFTAQVALCTPMKFAGMSKGLNKWAVVKSLLVSRGIVQTMKKTYVRHQIRQATALTLITRISSINRFFMKLFRTSNIETVSCCQEYFRFALPSTLWAKRVHKEIGASVQ